MQHRLPARLAPFALLVLMALSIGFTAAASAMRHVQGQWVSHTLRVLAKIEGARAAEAEVRYRERNAALGGGEAERRGHADALAAVEAATDDLRRMVADNPAQLRLLAHRLAEWNSFVRESRAVVRPQAPLGERIALTMATPHRRRFERAGGALEDMRREERRLLAVREASLERTVMLFNGAVVATALVMGLSFVLFARLSRKERRARREADDAGAAERAALEGARLRMESLAEAAFEGIAITQDGVLVDANSAFVAMFGHGSVDEMRGMRAELFAAPESRELVVGKRAALDEEPYEAILLRQDGSTFAAELRGRATEVAGRPARVTAVRDLTHRKEAERAVRESEARLAEAQRVARVGSWSWDIASGRISWSDELFRIFGLEAAGGEPKFDEMLGRHHSDDVAALMRAIDEAVAEGRPYELDLRIAQNDGSYRWARAVGRGERDSAGAVVRLYGTLADVHERKLLASELRARADDLARSQAELSAVLESAPLVLYAVDREGIVTVSQGAGLAAMGLEPGEAVGRSAFEFSEGDAESESFTRRALAGESLSYETRFGNLAIQTELRPTRGEDGEPSGFIGVCLDITERARSEERFRVLFEKSSDAHLLFDESGIIDCNPAAVRLLKCEDISQVLSIHPAALSPEFQPDGRRSDEKCVEMDGLARRNGLHRFEWTHRKFDGEEFPVEVSLTHVALGDRDVLLVVWHDLTQIKAAERKVSEHAAKVEEQRDELAAAYITLEAQQTLLDGRLAEVAEMNVELEAQRYALDAANERLSALATVDGLTGLKNQGAFHERLAEECKEASRLGHELSLLVLDVDKFKAYNDSFGHPAGDAALRSVGAVLGSQAREYDVAARNGGEEFALLLPGTDAASAALVAERVRRAVEGEEWPLRPVTVSVGVATLRPFFLTAEEFVEAADRALYAAKEGGRNRVAVAAAVNETFDVIAEAATMELGVFP